MKYVYNYEEETQIKASIGVAMLQTNDYNRARTMQDLANRHIRIGEDEKALDYVVEGRHYMRQADNQKDEQEQNAMWQIAADMFLNAFRNLKV